MLLPGIAMAKLPSEEEISTATAAFEPYFAAVGRVVHAWNHLQEQLGVVFCELAQLDRGAGLAIWHANANDGAQRRMLAAAAQSINEEKLTLFPTAEADIKWLLEKTDKVADRRNNAVHAPCHIALGSDSDFEIVPAFGLNPRARKLRGKQVLEEFEWCAQSADALKAFARGIDVALTLDGYAWPDRPSLPAPPRAK
jgi:hypothetical protein